MGARPMARLIQDTIRKALADELLFGRLANGGKVTIDSTRTTRWCWCSRSSRKPPSSDAVGARRSYGRGPVASTGGRAGAPVRHFRLLLIAFLLWAGAGWADTPAAQPSVAVVRTADIDLAGGTTAVDVYQPSGTPSLGTAVVAHGFTRSRERHRDLGRALAEAGITAVIPDLPFTVITGATATPSSSWPGSWKRAHWGWRRSSGRDCC